VARVSPLLLLPLGLFGGLAVALGFGAGQPEVAVIGLIDRPLPAFGLPPLPGHGGTGLSGADLAGQVALVNVFAAWCTSCRAEHPLLMDLSARPGMVPIYGIDFRDNPGAGEVYLRRLGDPYAASGEDRSGDVALSFGLTGVPETYLVDADGRIRYRHIGPITEQIWTDVLEPLLADLKETAS
jgi:cytochrome c biogenesis protein CcmG/thiol:disulfide interchange protein DsbE